MAEAEAVQLKEEGNRHFQLQDYKAATKSYSQALKLTKDKALLATLYRNRAACGLKTESYVQAASDASRAIDINSSDIKALYRRCQALEHLGKLDQAFKDVQRCATLEPRNQNFQETLRRLNTSIQEKLRVQFSTDSRVQKMFEILLDESSDADKLEKAANNLIVLGREEAGAERIFQNNGVALLLQLVDTKRPELVLAAVRTLSGMCSGHRARATVILHAVRIDRICSLMAVENEEMSLAVCNLLQAVIDSLSGEDKQEHRGKEEALVLDTKKDLKQITSHLLDMLVSKKVSGQGRDQALNLLNKNVPRKDLAIHDNSRTIYVVDNGLRKILKVVGQVPDLPSCLPLTDNTRMLASVLINKLYDDLRCDPERDHFRKICEEYITGKFDPQDMDKNVIAIQTVSGILQGPFDLGNQLLGMKGVMEMMVALCGSEREVDQLVAVEALIHASTKLSRATFIITNGVSLLKEIYKTTKNEKIKIRTLVGLCKLGSAGGTDYGLRQFAEGSTEKLAKQCRKWLCNASIDTRTRRWAVEGLAYLTLDADVKDDFVQDIPALQAMFELAKTADKTILYSVATTLVNCTNSYDVKEVIPELVQLAKFSKQHVPEEHPKDKKDFIDMRVKRLLKAGVTSALACMVKADNAILTDQTKELLARVFLALCDNPKDRGTIVAQGGGKALIPLALEGTDVGKVKAAHALAKIAAVSNPDIAFPGERVYEVVRPLVSLLDTQRDGLQNYEALLGLTNLSGRSDKLRQKIFKEKALPDIENYMFENHDQLRQAATECMCNMVVNKEVQERFLADGNDRLKLVVLLCGEDDDKVQNAAAGALAMLTAAHKKLCLKMTQVTTQWLEILQRLCLHDRLSVQHRGLVIAYNLLAADAELAKKLVESELLEILTVVGKQEPDEKKAEVVQTARECLIKCMDYGFIKPVSQTGAHRDAGAGPVL
ncbi:protein unc-45 homolog B isoform 1-T3 [Lycaon pictus]|nr:protein unc-45 homolog B [Canis lupus familiaris]XP_005624857.1 protein unc-45 homolog B [Canis lupus familiaris]XP_022279011.1 protein unc-45 homolog B [Canis lupus familiaris]XP_025295962.1 protein unc-45 homolog B [Canis lupus dingo]XP_038533245.1 protein unc-45 homolog B [Canis lupus familiaris]XP_038533246.1 protein unc-45 homolog B [Canis lupus familiaris]XP_038533247.1 protein unc-45 homolog B [Canis lupus familiaris]XP_038533248.1 protein unc-45 homolog B [Canis lupus familiaris]|eukprot:XP_005624856.1 protein unc-45 homolog B [Canis lupus familiaris]